MNTILREEIGQYVPHLPVPGSMAAHKLNERWTFAGKGKLLEPMMSLKSQPFQGWCRV